MAYYLWHIRYDNWVLDNLLVRTFGGMMSDDTFGLTTLPTVHIIAD